MAVKIFFIRLIKTVLFFCSLSVFAHNGSHETKNCFVAVAENQLRFSGYQFQGLHPDATYCHSFPFLGSLLIKIEAMNAAANEKQIALQLIKPNIKSLWGIENESPPFVVIKSTPFRSSKEVIMLQASISERGFYALTMTLQDEQQRQVQQQFYFLAGIPVTQLLLLFSLLVLAVILGLFFTKQRSVSPQTKNSEAGDKEAND